jgi:hypothetical protein
VNSDKMTLGPLDHCGVWNIVEETASDSSKPSGTKAEQAPPLLEVACNLSSAPETDIRPLEELLSTNNTVSPVLAGLGSRPIWFWLLLTGLILTTLEWAMYQRRAIS